MAAKTAFQGNSDKKHQAIMAVAEKVFLARGYLGTNMDDIAARARVSKQTVYKHFGTKQVLFIEIVTRMTSAASDSVHLEMSKLTEDVDVEKHLVAYAERQLLIVLTPKLMQLRRLVIGEVGRFPQLASALNQHGLQRAIAALAARISELAKRGLLDIYDAQSAAEDFNWLAMAGPLDRVMLLGDGAIPTPKELRAHAIRAVRTFLKAYGRA